MPVRSRHAPFRLLCPSCGSGPVAVINSRVYSSTRTRVTRRRRCLSCDQVWTTYEAKIPFQELGGSHNRAMEAFVNQVEHMNSDRRELIYEIAREFAT